MPEETDASLPDLINPTLQWLRDLTIANVPWLTQTVNGNTTSQVYLHDPGAVYSGLRPYAVWQCPQHSIAHRESGEIGNAAGKPNIYTCSYRETPYEKSANLQLQKGRAYQTYAIIGLLLCSPDGRDACPPEGIDLVLFEQQHDADAMYILTAAGPMVGTRIIAHYEERYNL